ncbi:MAG: corrinoid protein [Candidatus Eisenbacteria sp.]|nr:corrinoid protein [Candidatus Eisenbacteria bacterium]
MNSEALLKEMREAVIQGNSDAARNLAEKGLAAGVDVNKILDEGFVKGIEHVGRLWEDGEYFLPELVRGAEAMKAALAVIEPAILAGGQDRKRLGRAVIGTIEGDIHDIGKTLVAAMMTAYGFEVTDLGADVPVTTFVEKTKETGAELVCMSALLTTTMVGQKKVVDLLRERGIPAKVIVGGAPVSQDWADEIGADGYGESAVAAVEVARSLVA